MPPSGGWYHCSLEITNGELYTYLFQRITPIQKYNLDLNIFTEKISSKYMKWERKSKQLGSVITFLSKIKQKCIPIYIDTCYIHTKRLKNNFLWLVEL